MSNEKVIENRYTISLFDFRNILINFVKSEEASEAFGEEAMEAMSPVKQGPGGELAVVAMECFLVTIETGSGTSPIPLIKFQSSITLTASGFFSKKVSSAYFCVFFNLFYIFSREECFVVASEMLVVAMIVFNSGRIGIFFFCNRNMFAVKGKSVST